MNAPPSGVIYAMGGGMVFSLVFALAEFSVHLFVDPFPAFADGIFSCCIGHPFDPVDVHVVVGDPN